jgi:hypothetical protein
MPIGIQDVPDLLGGDYPARAGDTESDVSLDEIVRKEEVGFCINDILRMDMNHHEYPVRRGECKHRRLDTRE